MSHPHPRVDPPRIDFASEDRRDAMAGGKRRVPAWDRERLIDQFQRIDGSTRSEAERQVADLAHGFWIGIEGAHPLRGDGN